MKQLLLDLIQKNEPSRTITSNCMELINREVVGVSKYGVTLPDAGLTHEQLLQHGREEALDLANYLEAAIMTTRLSHIDHAELVRLITQQIQDITGQDPESRRIRGNLKQMMLKHQEARTLRALSRD